MSGLVDDLFDRSITDCKGLDITSGKPFRSCCFFAQAGAPWCHIVAEGVGYHAAVAQRALYCASKKRSYDGVMVSSGMIITDFAS